LKNLDIIHSSLEDFYLGSNYTWSVSNVDLTAENTLAQTSSNRELQGHSPHVFNFQVGYDNADWGTTATLLYNIAAKRIVSVGLLGAPDKYEQPFNQLDFIASQSINEWLSIRVKMKNLLDDKVIVTQGGETTRLYTRGREFKIGVNVSF
jgi:outer membrane receptor protein involved in Fe transport